MEFLCKNNCYIGLYSWLWLHPAIFYCLCGWLFSHRDVYTHSWQLTGKISLFRVMGCLFSQRDAHIYCDYFWGFLYVHLTPDVKNFFHNALTVIFAIIYFRRKLSSSSIAWHGFSSCAIIVCGSYANFFFCHWTKMQRRTACTDS